MAADVAIGRLSTFLSRVCCPCVALRYLAVSCPSECCE
jgi:hypothetical protein